MGPEIGSQPRSVHQPNHFLEQGIIESDVLQLQDARIFRKVALRISAEDRPHAQLWQELMWWDDLPVSTLKQVGAIYQIPLVEWKHYKSIKLHIHRQPLIPVNQVSVFSGSRINRLWIDRSHDAVRTKIRERLLAT